MIRCGNCGVLYDIKMNTVFNGNNWNFDYLMSLGWELVADNDGNGGYYICPKCKKGTEKRVYKRDV